MRVDVAIFEPRQCTRRENTELYSELPTRSYTNLAVQPQKKARGLQFRIWEVEELYSIYVAKIKPLVRYAQLVRVFDFAYSKSRFSLLT